MATSGETTSSLFAVNRDSACAVRNKKGKLKGREEEPTSSVRFQTSPLIWSKLENSIVGIQHVKQQTEQIPSSLFRKNGGRLFLLPPTTHSE